jgi:hypothetical protein
MPSTRRWPIWLVIVATVFFVLVGGGVAAFIYVSVRTYLEFAEMNPLADVGISHDLTPVEITFTTPRDNMRWRIPKAYITDRIDWQGGEQPFIDIEAALYWNSPDMPPFAIAGDPRSRGQRPDDEIYIDLRPSAHFFTDELWRKDKLRTFAPIGTQGDLTVYHDVNPRSESSMDHVFAPTIQAEHIIYFDCGVGMGDVLVRCAANADFSENIWLEYIFDSKYLERWREIDARVRRLVASFLQTGGGPRAAVGREP